MILVPPFVAGDFVPPIDNLPVSPEQRIRGEIEPELAVKTGKFDQFFEIMSSAVRRELLVLEDDAGSLDPDQNARFQTAFDTVTHQLVDARPFLPLEEDPRFGKELQFDPVHRVTLLRPIFSRLNDCHQGEACQATKG